MHKIQALRHAPRNGHYPVGQYLEVAFTTVAMLVDAREAVTAIAEPFANEGAIFVELIKMTRVEFAGVTFWTAMLAGSVLVIVLDSVRLLRAAVYAVKHEANSPFSGQKPSSAVPYYAAQRSVNGKPVAGAKEKTKLTAKHKSHRSLAPTQKGNSAKIKK